MAVAQQQQPKSSKRKAEAPPSTGGSSRAWDAVSPALSGWIVDAVASMGFSKMTPVQASTIPLFVGNKDVVVEAVTGSGKTLAFLIPVVEKLLAMSEPMKKHHVGAIVISPTRELASQIHSVLVSLLGFHQASAAALEPEMDEETGEALPTPREAVQIVSQLVVGGKQTPREDLAQFMRQSSNILIGTPGRLLELLSSKYVHCTQSSFEVLVLDEADRLLDLGFKDDLQNILSRLPKQRRTGLFSASVSEAVDQIIRVGLRNPVRIMVKVKSGASGALDKRTPASLQMTYAVTKPTEKLPALARLLAALDPTPQKSILYVSTCAAVDYFQHILPTLLPSFTIVPLHGKHAPKVRERNFAKFSQSLAPSVLLTTDVAARGLDIPLVDLVVQLDPPADPKAFLHRCGRAGRAGRRGLAVALLTPGRELDYVPFLAVRKTPLVELPLEGVTPVPADEAATTTRTIRDIVRRDRALHDKAQKAFVSWVRAYSKHTAASIFRVADLDWDELASAWGLLRMPKMPELKEWKGDRALGIGAGAGANHKNNYNDHNNDNENQTDEAASPGIVIITTPANEPRIDFKTFAYADPVRERARLAEIAAMLAERAANNGEPIRKRRKDERLAANEAWSAKRAGKEAREERREKRSAKREGVRRGRMTEEERREQGRTDEMVERVRARTRESERMVEEEFEGFSD